MTTNTKATGKRKGKRKPYEPTETHLALHPPQSIAVCKCGVKFAIRTTVDTDTADIDDNPKLCLTCNRKGWSRLWNDNRPINHEAGGGTGEGEVVLLTDRRVRR